MLEALQIVRLWPRQIASDLRRFWHCRMADWHSGELSSYELLELFGVAYVDVVEDGETRKLIELEHAPEDGAVAKAIRGGDWPEWVQILAELHKEESVYHAAKYSTPRKKHQATVFLSPVERRKRQEQAVADAQERQDSQSDFDAQMGWT
ncbi:hypothetical protein MTY414_59530 [Mycolicibacterium mageritense]|nr:hypothetical protein MTY414_59530 [Mycolicibacterium mageritense]